MAERGPRREMEQAREELRLAQQWLTQPARAGEPAPERLHRVAEIFRMLADGGTLPRELGQPLEELRRLLRQTGALAQAGLRWAEERLAMNTEPVMSGYTAQGTVPVAGEPASRQGRLSIRG